MLALLVASLFFVFFAIFAISDILDLISLCKDIEEAIGEKSTFYSSSDAYCGYVRLPSKKYVCLDSKGRFNSELTVFPGQRGYCDGLTFNCSK